MKIIIRVLAAIAFFSGYSVSAFAQDDLIKNILKLAVQKGPNYACQKGTVSSMTFRSMAGKLCTDKLTAALAIYLCSPSNTDAFNSTTCYDFAKQTLGEGNMTPEKTKGIIWQEANSKGGEILDSVIKLIPR